MLIIIHYFSYFVKWFQHNKNAPLFLSEAFFVRTTDELLSASTAVATIAAVTAIASAVSAAGEEDDENEDDNPPVATEAR